LIPKGWEVKLISEVVAVNYGKNLPKTKWLGGNIPVYGAAGIVGYYTQAMFLEPIILVTSRGSGSGTVHETSEPCFVTNNSFSVIPINPWFSRHYLRQCLLNSDIEALVTGSAQPQLTISNFSALRLLNPPKAILEQFHKIADALWAKASANRVQSRTLAALRDTLLPRLLSGELRVGEAAATLEVAR